MLIHDADNIAPKRQIWVNASNATGNLVFRHGNVYLNIKFSPEMRHILNMNISLYITICFIVFILKLVFNPITGIYLL